MQTREIIATTRYQRFYRSAVRSVTEGGSSAHPVRMAHKLQRREATAKARAEAFAAHKLQTQSVDLRIIDAGGRVTDHGIEQIVKRREAGSSLRAIAKDLGLGFGTVQKYAKGVSK